MNTQPSYCLILKQFHPFSITINSVNLSTKGEYGIDVPEKKFTISITSKLFVEDEGGELQVVEGETPAYVYYASNPSMQLKLHRFTKPSSVMYLMDGFHSWRNFGNGNNSIVKYFSKSF